MKAFLLVLTSVVLCTGFAADAWAQNKLKRCPILWAVWNDCLGERRFQGIKYRGEWKHDLPNGRGTELWEDGTKYEGAWVNGQRHGDGTLSLANGNKYVGSFENGTFHGFGTYSWRDGRKFVGEYAHGKANGEGTLYAANGSVIGTGIWRNDDLISSTAAEQEAAPVPTTTPTDRAAPGSLDQPQDFSEGGITVRVSRTDVSGQVITRIVIDGEIKPGDARVFKNALLTVGDDLPVVFLNSPGGDLASGIEIGNTIWTNEFATAVLNDSVCASACALAWLAGRPRFVEPGAAIGFHAPTKVDDPSRRADSVGSAVTGGYLNQLGFKTGAIAYMTEMGPDEMRWLSPGDAERLGIHYGEWAYGFQ